MMFVAGIVMVIVCILGSYGAHGSYGVLWVPLEYIMIFGGTFATFLASNPKVIVTGLFKNMGGLVKGPKYGRPHYEELLGVLYSVFRLAKTKGDLALESHVEKPEESSLFTNFPMFHGNHHAVEFLCDYLRLLTLGASNPHELENVMEMELEIHHEEDHQIAGAMQGMADTAPAIGIVAAVLGVIITMGSISEPPEVLGSLIAAALVGTFLGIFLAYGFFAPMASVLGKNFAADAAYMNCIKTGLIGHMQGYAPQVSVEFARKSLDPHLRPTFAEVEEMVAELPQA